jgi:eukaryotic-like serine/threonine-protein kinase
MGSHAKGRLRLLEPIGEGGASTVWTAWDVQHRSLVAAKVVAAGRSHHPLGERSLRLTHPHVVAPYAVVAEGPSVVLAMDLVRGGTADDLLARHGALPADYVAVLLDQLLQALDAVHAEGLVHGDVKPANILLEPTGSARPHLRLGDFGAASALGELCPPRSATDGYLSPEAATGAPPGPRQDLYAAGVTAAELLTGRRPRDERDLPRGPLRRLLADLAAPEPRARPPTATAARDRLRTSGVPEGRPWCERPHPPVVADRFLTGHRE